MDNSTMAWIGAIMGGVVGVLGGATGVYFSIKNTNGPKEKSFIIKIAIISCLAIMLFLLFFFVIPFPYGFILFVPYGIVLPIGIIYLNRKQQEIRKSEM